MGEEVAEQAEAQRAHAEQEVMSLKNHVAHEKLLVHEGAEKLTVTEAQVQDFLTQLAQESNASRELKAQLVAIHCEESLLQIRLNSLGEELATSELERRASAEKSFEQVQRYNQRHEETSEELECVRLNAAQAERAHREARHSLMQQILGLEEDVERLDFASRRLRHTANEESRDACEAMAEYAAKRDEVAQFRAERAELAHKLSEEEARATACEEAAAWDRRRRIAADEAAAGSEEHQVVVLDEL